MQKGRGMGAGVCKSKEEGNWSKQKVRGKAAGLCRKEGRR